MIDFSIVVPTVGRSSLATLVRSLAACDGPRPARVVVVDDRPGENPPLQIAVEGWPMQLVEVHRSGGRGPAAARNVGWRACRSEWIAFLDDDVAVTASWLRDLRGDLGASADDVAGNQALIEVPLPAHRRPTDWERNTAGLASARWITADMAYRRAALLAVGGFDERFPRAFREDADLALRTLAAGWRLTVGRRRTVHSVRPARWTASVAAQRGNADDALMRRLHGPSWHDRAGATPGRGNRHLIAVLSAAVAAAALAIRRRGLAAGAAGVALGELAAFAWARIAPGPRDRREVTTMAVTSALIPPAATAHRLRGAIRHRHARPWRPPVRGVLLDRDGTLVHDVPYNGRPELVRPIDGVREALSQLRAAGVKLGVITNQSGVARGLLELDQVHAVNERVDALLGPFDTWQICPHGEQDGCACRKPEPGMVQAAAAELGIPVAQCVVVGDTAADVAAGRAAGAVAAFLVPNDATRPDEVLAAERCAVDLAGVVAQILPPCFGARA